MLQPGRGTDFPEEALRAERRQLGTKQLEGDVTLMPEVARQVDPRHAAVTQFPLDVVSVGQGGLESRGGDIGQRKVLRMVLY